MLFYLYSSAILYLQGAAPTSAGPANANQESPPSPPESSLAPAHPSEGIRPYQRPRPVTLKPGEEFIRSLGENVNVIKKTNPPGINPPFDIRVRYHFPKELKEKAERYVAYTRLADQHPNALMSLITIKHRDNSYDIDTEYADGGTLGKFNEKLKPEHREFFALSVAFQLLHSLAYFHNVHNLANNNVTTRHIYLRRDGCLKTDLYNLLPPEKVNEDWSILENSIFVSPERRTNPTDFLFQNGDTWAAGAIIYAILKGKNYDSSSDDRAEFDAFVASGNFEALTNNKMLQYLMKHLLVKDPTKRFNALQALAFCYLFTTSKETLTVEGVNLKHPWRLEEQAFAPSLFNERRVDIGEQLRSFTQDRESFELLSTIFGSDADQATEANNKLQEKINTMDSLLLQELNTWKELRHGSREGGTLDERENAQRRTVDKLFREVIKNREIYAWKALSLIEEHVRMLKKAREAEERFRMREEVRNAEGQNQ